MAKKKATRTNTATRANKATRATKAAQETKATRETKTTLLRGARVRGTTDRARTTLRDVERDLRELETRRDELDRAIVRLRRVMAWLRRGQAASVQTTSAQIASAQTASARGAHAPRAEDTVPQSLTNACRAVLRMSASDGLTPREVKRVLTESGFAWDAFTNPMSAIHTVLKRLVSQGEAAALIDRDGHRRFAVRRTTVVAMSPAELKDDVLLQKLLEADAPDAVIAALKTHRL